MKSRSSSKGRRLSLQDLRSAIRRNMISPCYLFAGPELFIADEAITILKDALVPEEQRSFNVDVLYGHDAEPHEITALASSYPMMGERRLVVVKEVDKLRKADTLTSYIKNPLESTVLVLVSEKPDFRKNPYRVFPDSTILDCSSLYESQIPEWIVRQVKRIGKTISSDAAELLAGYTGNSLRQVANEIEKLDIYTAERKEITADDVSGVVGVTRAYNIFELQKAIGQKDVRGALHILERMLERGESPVFIISMLTRFFSQLAILADLRQKNLSRQQVANQLNINQFFLDDYYGYLDHHPTQVMSDRFRALLTADVDVKTTTKSPHLVLALMLYRLVDKDTSTLNAAEAFEERLII